MKNTTCIDRPIKDTKHMEKNAILDVLGWTLLSRAPILCMFKNCQISPFYDQISE